MGLAEAYGRQMGEAMVRLRVVRIPSGVTLYHLPSVANLTARDKGGEVDFGLDEPCTVRWPTGWHYCDAHGTIRLEWEPGWTDEMLITPSEVGIRVIINDEIIKVALRREHWYWRLWYRVRESHEERDAIL